jgi:sugar lactone lactonase YvrE
VRFGPLALVGACTFTLGSGACRDASDPELARGKIGPDGGILVSVDSILTIAILPQALEETIELTIERSEEPPDVYGPAFRVRPNVALAIPATVSYRYPLPDDTSQTAVGYVDAEEFSAGDGRWRPLPVVKLEPERKLVTSTDTQLSLFYGLLDDSTPPPATTDAPDTSDGPTTNPTGDGTTTVDPDTSDGTTVAVDPDTSAGPTTGPGDTSSEGETTDGETTASVDPCDDLPMGPFAVEEFMFTGTPLDANAEDMTFSSVGSLIVRNGADLVQISPAGVVTPIATDIPLPETLGLRWTAAGTVVTATYFTGELLQITPAGTVTTLWSGLGIPNGVYPALDGNIFFTDYTGALAAYIDGAGTMLTELGAGGDEAPEANGIIYDPDRGLVYYVAYGPGVVYRVDVSDLGNPAAPVAITTIVSEGGGDQVGLDGVSMDACGNLYIVDQNQGDPGSLYRLFLDDAGELMGAPQLMVDAFPDGVANAVFAQGPGWEAFSTYLFAVGLPGRIFMLDVGVAGAPTAAGG